MDDICGRWVVGLSYSTLQRYKEILFYIEFVKFILTMSCVLGKNWWGLPGNSEALVMPEVCICTHHSVIPVAFLRYLSLLSLSVMYNLEIIFSRRLPLCCTSWGVCEGFWTYCRTELWSSSQHAGIWEIRQIFWGNLEDAKNYFALFPKFFGPWIGLTNFSLQYLFMQTPQVQETS